MEHRAWILVRTILEASDGSVWLGTWGNGLQRYDPRADSFEYYYEQQGLPNNFVKGVMTDATGNLWVSTEKGLARFDLQTRRFRTYTTDDGLQGDLFLSGSACRGRDGMIYFGGAQGLNFFHPDSIRDDPIPPPIVITGFRIFEREQPPSFWRGTTVELEYEQDFVSFEFVALDYTNSSRIQYAYRLEGFNRDWIQSGTRRVASYTHLDGGDYTLRVRATNSDGVWNEEGASVQIRIKPPFWLRWWFILGAVAVVASGIAIGFQIRLRHQLALERLRQRIASDLHDDVGTELSSIVLGSQYLARTLPLADADRTKIEKLGSTARKTHEMMRDIVWMLTSDNDTLDDLFVKMREVAGRLLEGTHWAFSAPVAGEPMRLRPEVKRNLFLFFKEALNNVVRHSSATEVEIRVARLESDVELLLIDNGRGFSELHIKRGAGLGNLRARAEAMKAALEITSNEGGGTTVRLRCAIPQMRY